MKQLFLPMGAKDGTIISYTDTWEPVIECKNFCNLNFIAEMKYDGSRYILQWDFEWKVFLTSRNVSVKDGLPVDKTENLRGYLYNDCVELAYLVLDWEILVKMNWKFLTNNGSSEVNRIMLSAPEKAQERLKNSEIELVYVVYDILNRNGNRLTSKPLSIRKHELRQAYWIDLNNAGGIGWVNYQRILLSEVYPPTKDTYKKAIEKGFEGIMLKDLTSEYIQWEHSKHWLKVKKFSTEDGIVMWGQIGTWKYKNTLGALIIWQFFRSNDYTLSETTEFLLDGYEDIIFKMEDDNYVWKKIEGELVLHKLKEVCTIWGMTDELRSEYWWWLNEEADRGTAYVSKIPKEEWNIYFEADYIEDSEVVEFLAQEKTVSRYRHPRFKCKREDKNMVDCIFYESEKL